MKPNVKTGVIALAGGLGNQLFQASAALSFGTDKYNFVFKTGIYNCAKTPSGNPQVLDFIPSEFPPHIEIDDSAPKTILHQKIFNYLLGASTSNQFLNHAISSRHYGGGVTVDLLSRICLSEGRKFAIPKGIGWDPNFLPSLENDFLLGYFQGTGWLENNSFINQLRSDTFFEMELNHRQLHKASNEESPLIIQIRRGDYLSNDDIGTLDVSYFVSAFDEMWSSGDYGTVWIFSDDQKVFMQLPNRIKKVSRSLYNHNLSPGAILEQMRYGKGYIISNSTFGWWGSYLSHADAPKIVAPHKWFKKIQDPELMIPFNWRTHSSIWA